MTIKSELQTVVRRIAAKIVSDYPAPPLAYSEDLLNELESAAQSEAPEGEWATLATAISDALRQHGVDQFLRLPPIAKTLHPRIRSPGRKYVAYLLNSKKFSPALHKALTESPVGKPLLNPYYPLSSPLLVQHGYHLVRLLEATDFDLSGVRLVAEFGGGYGGFFRLLRNLGYRDRYVICDLPVMCALQRFYLRNLFPTEPGAQPPENVQWISNDVPGALKSETAAASGPSLFIATWSLSETPLTVRTDVAPALDGFTYILCAYQRAFGGYDNVQYFGSWEKQLPGFVWQNFECPVYAGNFYLIGQKQRT
jgi:putative sugar O-methyltransferase